MKLRKLLLLMLSVMLTFSLVAFTACGTEDGGGNAPANDGGDVFDNGGDDADEPADDGGNDVDDEPVLDYDPNAPTIATAFVGVADKGWNPNSFDDEEGDGWKRTDAEIKGNGTYTVRVDFDEPLSGSEIAALGTSFAAEGSEDESVFIDYPDMTIEIVTFKSNLRTFAKEANYFPKQEGNVMRVMLYNPWRSDDESGTYILNGEDLEGAEWIEITFRIAGIEE